MFAAFGDDYMQQRSRNIMTGFVVFFIIICIALFMIIYGKILLHKAQEKESNNKYA